MYDILHELTIAATPDKLYQAITEQSGLAAWWLTAIIAEPKVGSTVEASSSNGQLDFKLEVITLEPGRKVAWSARQSKYEDWLGTHVTFDLTPVENGTKLLFGHRGFASADGALPMVSYHWATYLTSLKDYLEKGKGNPYTW